MRLSSAVPLGRGRRSGAARWLLWAALSLSLACGPLPSGANPTPPAAPAAPVSTNFLTPRPREPRQLSPSQQAQDFAEQGRQRLVYLADSPEGNGYQVLLEIQSRPGGLLELAGLADKHGVAMVASRVQGPHGQPGTPFHDDFKNVMRASTYRHLAIPLKVSDSGPVPIPQSERFVNICSALRLLPALEIANRGQEIEPADDLDNEESDDTQGDSDNVVEELLQNFRSYLGMARAICLGAACMEHYEQGIALEQTALEQLAQVVKSGQLTTSELRQVISGQQQLLSSLPELQAVLDSEFFLAVRGLEARDDMDQKAREAARDELAARYLAVRPLFEAPQMTFPVSPGEMPDPVSQVAREWANKKDFLPLLVRSRLVYTRRSAVEVMAGLEAYRQDKGEYPESLDQIVPAYLSRMPYDSFSDGGKFVYSRTPNGYSLESVSPALPSGKDGRIRW